MHAIVVTRRIVLGQFYVLFHCIGGTVSYIFAIVCMCVHVWPMYCCYDRE
jgi:hypothetical protein